MRIMTRGAIGVKSFLLLAVLGTAVLGMHSAAPAQEATTSYPNMAPVEQYFMNRTAEIALARTAAPESITGDAEVMVLGPHGFETAVQGKNGFVCAVERSWSSAPDPDFYNPRVRVPICYNAAAARSFFLRNKKRTELFLAGRTKAQIDDAIIAAVDKQELPAMAPGAMCYMLSKLGYGGDAAPHWPAHLMFYFSEIDPAIWGANAPGSPVLAMSDAREHLTEFVIPVQHWSDGTAAQ